MESKPTKHAPVVDARIEGEKHRRSSFVFKILALVMALGIWFYAQSVNNPSSESVISDVPVKVVNLQDDGLSVMTGNSLSVDLRVAGKKKNLDKLTAESFLIVCDASGITEAGEYTLRTEVQKKPDGVTVVGQSATVMQVYLDVRDQVEIPVSVSLNEYVLSSDLEFGKYEPSVDRVTVSGPSTLLSEIVSAHVKLSFAGQHIEGSMRASGQIELIGKNGNLISDNSLQLDIRDVEVFIPVYGYKDIPLRVNGMHGYYTEETAEITVSPSTVRVKGEPALLASIPYITLADLDETRVTEDSITLPIALPDGLTRVGADDGATVEIRHKNTVLTTLAVSNITVKNAAGLQYTVRTETLHVKLRIARSDLHLLSSENISLVCDFASLEQTSGRTQIPAAVKITGLDGVLVYAVGEYWITVEIA